jgi:hypothetical protein
MERHTRLTINTSELMVVKKLQGTAKADCLACGVRVGMATPEQAVSLTGILLRTLYGWRDKWTRAFLRHCGRPPGHLP